MRKGTIFDHILLLTFATFKINSNIQQNFIILIDFHKIIKAMNINITVLYILIDAIIT